MIGVEHIGKTETEVYDICLDGTVVSALGMCVLHNTDGFNFQMPQAFRYTDEHPYISDGGGRNSVKGKSYVGVEADVCEFEDIFLNTAYNGGIKKWGLGIDEFCDACIQASRKNYLDLMPDGGVKIVGNTLKSKKMPLYIERFLNVNIPLLLHGKGKEFLENYYDYIEKIYNMQIPLKEIASVGKIKTTLEDYKERCKERTKGGQKKARQAWYELAIKDGLDVHMGDAIYYINTGTKKNDSDIKRSTVYFHYQNGKKVYNVTDENGEEILDRRGNPISLTKQITKEYTKLYQGKMATSPSVGEYAKSLYPTIEEEDLVEFKCVRIPTEIIEDEDSDYINEGIEYNVSKYIAMFNNRIRPLFVCFDKSIRDVNGLADNIIITDPKNRKVFSDEECTLVMGQPYKTSDQDTYEQLMTMEDKEIDFWIRVNKIPPFVNECGMDWECMKQEYLERMEKFRQGEMKEEFDAYQKQVEKFSVEDLEKYGDMGILPKKVTDLVYEEDETHNLISKKFGVKLGNIYDFIDKNFETVTEE